MDPFQKLQSWGDSHRIILLDFLRIVVGAFITFKGVMFIANIDYLRSMTANMDLVFASAGLAHYVIFAHILGGPLLAFGLYTRVMAIIQIPILIGAIFFVNAQQGFLSVGNHMELELSIGVLLALMAFVVFGAGRYSVDHLRRRDEALHPHKPHF
ncbi:DoxX family protein [Fulvivirga sp. RKSG066]|uniref:DoxX family protein n=1 Tax=Fulvivirga aurantia TaxID=2529383 RepID=UPI0012BC01EE|nr:DoxX family protein [Fulvivirga aurantia]MTI20595.1 DoxX family protein [Fulvivirga aurantia]